MANRVLLGKSTNSNLGHSSGKFGLYIQCGENNHTLKGIKVKPNDTIVIPQKFSNYIFANVGTLNTLLSFLNLYLQIQNTVR